VLSSNLWIVGFLNTVTQPLHITTPAARHCCLRLHKATTVKFSYPHSPDKIRTGSDKHYPLKERERKCLRAMQVSLQLTHSVANKEMTAETVTIGI